MTKRAPRTPAGQSFQEAVPGLAKLLSRKGLRVPEEPSVPLYWADPREHGVLIRLLDGKKTRGRIDARGHFRALTTKQAARR